MCHLGSVTRDCRGFLIALLCLDGKESDQLLLNIVNYIDDVVSCFSKAFVILIPVAMSDF